MRGCRLTVKLLGSTARTRKCRKAPREATLVSKSILLVNGFSFVTDTVAPVASDTINSFDSYLNGFGPMSFSAGGSNDYLLDRPRRSDWNDGRRAHGWWS